VPVAAATLDEKGSTTGGVRHLDMIVRRDKVYPDQKSIEGHLTYAMSKVTCSENRAACAEKALDIMSIT